MNIHLNLKQMGNMIYEEEDINAQGVSRSMLAAESFSQEEDDSSSSCSMSSSSENDDGDDASSSSSNGPLEDLSDLMSHLPIKKGLSKFYEGKSQSFTSLENVKSLEDLMKREFKNRNYGAIRRKTCRSTGGIRVYSPKATISKKATRTPTSSLSRRRY